MTRTSYADKVRPVAAALSEFTTGELLDVLGRQHPGAPWLRTLACNIHYYRWLSKKERVVRNGREVIVWKYTGGGA